MTYIDDAIEALLEIRRTYGNCPVMLRCEGRPSTLLKAGPMYHAEVHIEFAQLTYPFRAIAAVKLLEDDYYLTPIPEIET